MDIYTEDDRVGPLPHTIYSMNLKWMRDLTGRAKTRKVLGKNIGTNLYDFVLKKIFLDMKSKA